MNEELTIPRAALVKEREYLRTCMEGLTQWEQDRLDELNRLLEEWDYAKYRQHGEVFTLY